MPNKPDLNTASTSFTLPKALMERVRAKAKVQMTNVSDVIRRALMNYLSEDERQSVLREIASGPICSYPPSQDLSDVMHDAPTSSLPSGVSAKASVEATEHANEKFVPGLLPYPKAGKPSAKKQRSLPIRDQEKKP
jgi:Arc/MetJ-type ribon-helix-helix transcriptional regulator